MAVPRTGPGALSRISAGRDKNNGILSQARAFPEASRRLDAIVAELRVDNTELREKSDHLAARVAALEADRPFRGPWSRRRPSQF